MTLYQTSKHLIALQIAYQPFNSESDSVAHVVHTSWSWEWVRWLLTFLCFLQDRTKKTQQNSGLSAAGIFVIHQICIMVRNNYKNSMAYHYIVYVQKIIFNSWVFEPISLNNPLVETPTWLSQYLHNRAEDHVQVFATQNQCHRWCNTNNSHCTVQRALLLASRTHFHWGTFPPSHIISEINIPSPIGY